MQSTVQQHPIKPFAILIAFVIGFAYRLIMSLQGVDDVDVGFCNTFYQCIFSSPDANSFNFIYYITGVIGGIWNTLFDQWGLFGFRLFNIITLTVSIFILYHIFKKTLTTKTACAAIVISFLFPIISITFHYDTLTFLFVALSAGAFRLFLINKNRGWLFITGLLIGISFFVRLVNLTLLALLAIPLLVGITQTTFKKGIQYLLFMLAGILLGTLCVIGFMMVFHHWDYFIMGIKEATGDFASSAATHSQGNLIKVYFRSMLKVILQTGCVGLFYWGFLTLQTRFKGKTKTALEGILCLSFFILALTGPPYLTTLGLCCMVLLLYLRQKPSVSHQNSIVLYLLLASFLLPVGSDIGIPGIFNWFAGLLLFPAISSISSFDIKKQSLLLTMFLCIGLAAIVKTSKKAYGESCSRTKSVVRINDSLNIYTDAEKAKDYRHFIACINKYKDKNGYMVLGNQYSALYYATNTKPFLGHTQTIIYQGTALTNRLNNRLTTLRCYPLIVFLNHRGILEETPSVHKSLAQWMKLHRYKTVYSDTTITLFSRNR